MLSGTKNLGRMESDQLYQGKRGKTKLPLPSSRLSRTSPHPISLSRPAFRPSTGRHVTPLSLTQPQVLTPCVTAILSLYLFSHTLKFPKTLHHLFNNTTPHHTTASNSPPPTCLSNRNHRNPASSTPSPQSAPCP